MLTGLKILKKSSFLTIIGIKAWPKNNKLHFGDIRSVDLLWF